MSKQTYQIEVPTTLEIHAQQDNSIIKTIHKTLTFPLQQKHFSLIKAIATQYNVSYDKAAEHILGEYYAKGREFMEGFLKKYPNSYPNTNATITISGQINWKKV
jgi:TolA-binding protein